MQIPVYHYYFESVSQECVCFPYFGLGCQGNDNNFLTPEDCSSICKSTTSELIATTTSMLESLANSTLETMDDTAETTATDSMATEPSTVQTLTTDAVQSGNSGLNVYAYICIGIGVITVLLVASSFIVISVVTWKILRVRLQQNKIM